MFGMFLKRFVACFVTIILCVTLFSGCGSSSESKGDGDAEAIQMTDTALVVNGEKITASKFRFYIFNAAYKYATLSGKIQAGIQNINWNEKDEASGKVIADIIKEEAKETAISDILMAQNGSKNGVSIEEEMKKNDAAIEKAIADRGQDFFDTRILAMGITSVEDYEALIRITTMAEKVQSDFDENPEKYIPADEDLTEFKSDENVTAQHILIKSNSTKTADPQKTINEVWERAKAGEDFYSLMEAYNEDTAETKAGYYFRRGIMSVEFEEAAFSLNLNEISDVVRTEHGYHVIKRLPGMGELINQWKDTVLINENPNVLKGVSVEEVINSAAEAALKLKNEYSLTPAQAEAEVQADEAETSGDKAKTTKATNSKSKSKTAQ